MQLGWIDISKDDRDRVIEAINLVKEPRAVDELGIRCVSDAFSNYFFPGITSNHTRAKYFLLVPYIILKATEKIEDGESVENLLNEVAKQEKRITLAWKNSTPNEKGIIGIDSCDDGDKWVDRTPSGRYWSGIQKYGIITQKIKISQYLKCCIQNRENEDKNRIIKEFWDDEFLELVKKEKAGIEKNVKLTKDEALYLKKKICEKCEGTLLEYLLNNSNDYKSFSEIKLSEIQIDKDDSLNSMLTLAKGFSYLIYLARIRYNCILGVEEANTEWEKMKSSVDVNVNLEEIFIQFPNEIDEGTRDFLKELNEGFNDKRYEDVDNLICEREHRIKKELAKSPKSPEEFGKKALSDKWVGGKELDYRFSNAKQIIIDIIEGEKER